MCTLEKRGPVYLLTLTGPGEHRLNPTLLTSILTSLRQIRTDNSLTKTPSALVTTAEGKFFSNGFDLLWAKTAPAGARRTMPSLHRHVVAELLSLPMPTIAAVTGHASAAGLVLAFSHDQILMRSDRGFLYMSETDIGLPIPDYFVRATRWKVSGARDMRRVVLHAGKVTAEEAVRMGIVDEAVEGVDGTVEAAVRMGEEMAGKGWDGKAYAMNRMTMLPELCQAVGVAVEGDEEKRRIVDSKL